MAKNYGVGYPERPLMAVISDLIGIEHFTTSNGGTVRSDFLRATLLGLGEDPGTQSKDGLIKACVEAATRRPFDERLLSPGATVTNQALQVMIDGITEHGVRGRLDPSRIAVVDDAAQADPEFDPGNITDERDRRLAERAARDGQSRFRASVLRAYADKCALTQTNAVGALEAAHITPYRGDATNVIANGICLRADMHRLWDGGQIALHEDTHMILLGHALLSTTYADLSGQQAAMPKRTEHRPSRLALRAHRQWCGLG